MAKYSNYDGKRGYDGRRRYDDREFDIDIDQYDEEPSRRRGSSHTMIIFVFVLVFAVVIASAGWLFLFSDRGMRIFDGENPQLAAPSARLEAMAFVGLAFKDVSLRMEKGQRKMIRPTFQIPPDSKDVDTKSLKLKWLSENPSVVSVDQHGTLVARSEGSARVSVIIDEDNIDCNAAYCLVQVGRPLPDPTPDRTDNKDTEATPSSPTEKVNKDGTTTKVNDTGKPEAASERKKDQPSDSAAIVSRVRNALK